MIHAICTCAISQIARLPQLVQHYRGLGIDRFWLTLHDDASEAVRRDARHTERVIEQLGLEQTQYLAGDFDAELIRDHHDRIQARHVAAGDWVLWIDADEFQIYPCDLMSFLENADRRGENAVGGEMLDRTARGGRLKEFDPQLAVWSQYPIACDFTGAVLRGYTHKVAAAKGNIPISPGNHEVMKRPGVKWSDHVIAIHHFKWDNRVLDYLAPRLQQSWRTRCCCWIETERAFRHIKEHHGLDITSLATFDFGDGYHLPVNAEAWAFVKGLRAGNANWHARGGFRHKLFAASPSDQVGNTIPAKRADVTE